MLVFRSFNESTYPGNYNTYQSVFILRYNLSPQVIVSLTKGTGDGLKSALTEDDLHSPFTKCQK